MANRSGLPALLLALSCFTVCAPARAEPTEADRAASRTIFARAREAMAAKKLDEACPAFVESQRIWPTASGALNVGNCEEQRGNLATAYGAFSDAAGMARRAGDKNREEEGTQRASSLKPKLSMLEVDVSPPNRIEGLLVKRDGREAGPGQWGIAVPVDPGEHTIEASAPGRIAWTTTIRIEPKPGATSVDVPALALAPVLQAHSKASTPRTGDAEMAGSSWSAQKTAALAVGGAGVVGIALGAIFGVKALGKKSDSEANCQPDDRTRCNATGVMLREDEKSAGTISTISFIAGGVALAGGMVLFVTAPGRPAKATAGIRFEALPAVAGGDVGLSVRARW
jgi:hypothetical protein